MGVWRHRVASSRIDGRPTGIILVVQTLVAAMLVLSRKVGEKILIGKEISVTVVRVGQGAVRIGVDAPDDLVIVREEIQRDREEVDDSGRGESSDAGQPDIAARS
jgi:carbon storage regulator